MKLEKELYESIKKKFRELKIPIEHIDHLLECEYCYDFIVENLKE
jgi:hypothetical protein